MTAVISPSAPPEQPVRVPETAVPLCVDLDGTLVRRGLLVEMLFALFARNPLAALKASLWLLHGKARLKAEVARLADLDVTSLPYNQRLLTYRNVVTFDTIIENGCPGIGGYLKALRLHSVVQERAGVFLMSIQPL